MLENRSFDHVLGAIPGVDGALPPGGARRSNEYPAGTLYYQSPTTSTRIKPDPKHETPNVRHQLKHHNGLFVEDYGVAFPDSTDAQRQEIMGFHPLGTLPAIHALAGAFAVCDRWYASVPGPTWTNRLFALSGTSLGRVKMPSGIFDPNLHNYGQTTIFDRLTQAGRAWRVYYDDFPLTLLFKNMRAASGRKHIHEMDRFREDAKKAADEFPEFAFIEPNYLWPGANDDHPPHDLNGGQRLIADVYAAIRANEELWRSTLLIVNYDEHGGFYDHVSPPPATPPDAHKEEYTFDRYGVRVPTVLVSPWIDPQVLSSADSGPQYDHTSVLRYLKEKWGLGGLGERTKSAANFQAVIRATGHPRTDAPLTVMPKTRALRSRAAATPPPERPSDLQHSIVALSSYLETQTKAPPKDKVRRSVRLMRGPVEQFSVARERARRFLQQ